MRKSTGVALVTTLLMVAAFLIAFVVILTILSLSNLRLSSERTLALEAQYAAESGVARSKDIIERSLQELENLLQYLALNIGNEGTAIDTLAQDLAALCYGNSYDDQTIQSVKDALEGNTSFKCSTRSDILKADLLNSALSDVELAKRWMTFFYHYIEPDVYVSVGVMSDNEENKEDAIFQYWGELLRGKRGNYSETVKEDEVEIRYRLTTNDAEDRLLPITPRSVSVDHGKLAVSLGSGLNEDSKLISIGEVVDQNGKILARRVIQLKHLSSFDIPISIEAPSYAWFAFFFDRQPDLDIKKMIVFTDSAVIDGPVHSNDYLAFEESARPWFGGPVSSAGPSTREGGIRAYWRNPTTGDGGYESPPDGQGINWLPNRSHPEFPIARNSLGEELCIHEETQEILPCKKVQNDDGDLAEGWTYKWAVDWNHSEIPLPGAEALDDMSLEAETGGIKILADNFCEVDRKLVVPHGDPAPTECLEKYVEDAGTNKITLRVENDVQIIRIELAKLVQWKLKKTKKAKWNVVCEGGGDGDDTGNPGVHFRPLLPKAQHLFSIVTPSWLKNIIYPWTSTHAQSSGTSACENIQRPTCPPGCTCVCLPPRDIYKRITEPEYLELRYDKNGNLQVIENTLSMDAVQYSESSFNGVVYIEPGSFYIQGPEKDGPNDSPSPAIAKYAQLTVTTPKDVYITGDLTYASPPCTKTPHRDTNDEDNDGDTMEIIDRCDDEDYEGAESNLLGIYAKNIFINPEGVWHNPGADLTIHAVLMAYGGSISTYRVDDCDFSYQYGKLKLLGGMIQSYIGPINLKKDCEGVEKFLGYQTALSYDKRMLTGLAPPAFPRFTQGIWRANTESLQIESADGFWLQVPFKSQE